MKREYLMGLVRAYATGDRDRFRTIALQAAAAIGGRAGAEIHRLVGAAHPAALSPQHRRYWMQRETAERPWYPRGVATRIDALLEEWPYRTQLRGLGIPPASRLLLHGPTACGKTMTARWLGAELRLPVYVAQLHTLVQSHLGETASNVTAALDVMEHVPAVWVLDEIDAVAGRRGGEPGAAEREMDRTVNALCILLDQLVAPAGLVVATTNRPDTVDPAILRRFDEVIGWPEWKGDELGAFCARVGFSGKAASFGEAVQLGARERRRKALAQLQQNGSP